MVPPAWRCQEVPRAVVSIRSPEISQGAMVTLPPQSLGLKKQAIFPLKSSYGGIFLRIHSSNYPNLYSLLQKSLLTGLCPCWGTLWHGQLQPPQTHNRSRGKSRHREQNRAALVEWSLGYCFPAVAVMVTDTASSPSNGDTVT